MTRISGLAFALVVLAGLTAFIAVGAGGAAAETDAGNVTIELQPSDAQPTNDSEVTVDVVVTGADNSIDSYDFTLVTDDPGVASFESAADELGSANADVTVDSDEIRLFAQVGTNSPEESNVTIATTTLATNETGNVSIAVDRDAELIVGDVDASAYTIESVDNASLEIVDELPAPDPVGNGQPATDTTGDGKLNDVTGSGEFNILDVSALFSNQESEEIQENAEQFDFANTGDVNVLDVSALFNDLQAADGDE